MTSCHKAAGLLLVLAALSACGGEESGAGPGGFSEVSYEILTSGQGDALAGPVPALNPGARLGQSFVRGYRFDGRDVVQVTGKRESETITGWLVAGEAGLLEVGDLRHGAFPASRMLLPTALVPGMSWRTDPFGLNPERIVPCAENPEGDSHAQDAETVTFTALMTPSPFVENFHQYTIWGWRGLWQRQSDILPVMTLVDGVGLLSDWKVDDAVLPDSPVPLPDPGPTVALEPVPGGSLIATSYRPTGLAVMERTDGSFLLSIRGEGTGIQVNISDMGSVAVSYAAPGVVCLTYEDGQFYEVKEDDCHDPESVLQRPDGSLVTMPNRRIELHDPYGNIMGVKYVTAGVLLETDEGIVHLSNEPYDAWVEPDCSVDKGLVVSLAGGSTAPGGIWKSQKQADGSYVLGFGGDASLDLVAAWSGQDALAPVNGPRLSSASARNSPAGNEYYRVTADGRLEEVLLRADGVRYRPLARLDLPSGHAVRAAVRLDGRRFLVFTHANDLGYDTQWYHENDYAVGGLVWKIDEKLPPDFGEGHLWFAEVPESGAEPTLPPISETMTIAPYGRNLELCWPKPYGAAATEGWTLAGLPPQSVLVSKDGSCVLLVRNHLEVAPLKMPGALWAHGPIPTTGGALVATVAQGTDGGWIAAAVPPVSGDPDTTEIVTPDAIYWENPLDAFGPAVPMAGADPRLDAGRLGLWYRGYRPSLVVPTPDTGLPPYYLGVINSISGNGGPPGAGSGITPFDKAGVAQKMTPEDAPEPATAFESAGVQGGGLLLQDRVLHFAEYLSEDVGYGVGQDRFIEPPALPSPNTPWRHEGMLFHGTLCGHLGTDTLYCIDGTGQRELAGVGNVSERQWWVTQTAPPPAGLMCPNSVDNGGCKDGRFWLLGASKEKPWVTLFDPEAMTVTEFQLSDFLPGFPSGSKEMFVETTHLQVPMAQAQTQLAAPVSVIGAASDAGPVYWAVRFGPDAPELLWGPTTFDFSLVPRWGEVVASQSLPRLRPLQGTWGAGVTAPQISVVSPALSLLELPGE
jgi:hypothetical protein